MTARPANLKRAKAQRRPIYFTVRRLCDPKTGEEFGALIPHNRFDQRAMRDRKYAVGSILRAEIKRSRNVAFHRLAHALGGMVVDQVPGFESLDAHSALKRLQRECGAFCDEMTVEIPGLGECAVKVPRSMSFDEMDEGAFTELFKALCGHLSAKYWPTLDPEAIEEQAQLIAGEHG